jgi:tripartite-type tricarboxylate transporter receptor subunit TctC
MKRLAVSLLAAMAVVLLVAGCGQAAPAPAAPAAKPTTAPASQPAAAPAAAYPEKGKVITQIVPYGSGGGADITARTIQPMLEKELGVSMPIINKPGGSGQVGMTDFLTNYKADGYSLVWTLIPGVPASYLDAERKATYTFKDIQLVSNFALDPVALSVKKGSQFKTLKDVVDYAKANPGKIRASSSGLMNTSHVAGVLFEPKAGIKLAHMFFEQQGEQRAALLGGHLEVELNTTSETAPGWKNGELEVLAVFDPEPNTFLPNVPTAKSLGYDVSMASSRGISMKAGTSMEFVKAIDAAVGRIVKSPENQAQFDKMMLGTRYLSTDDYYKYWAENEAAIKAVLEESKKK